MVIIGFPAIDTGVEICRKKSLKKTYKRIQFPLSIDLIKMSIMYMSGSDSIKYIVTLGLEDNQKFISSIKLKVECFTNRDLKILAHWKYLTYLDLSNSKVTDAGLSYFTSIPKPLFQELNLSNCELITDTGIRYLELLTNLKILNLSSTKISDCGLHILKSLTDLSEFNISDCKNITEQGYAILEFLQRTTSGSRLSKLCISDLTNVTDTIHKILEKLNPFTVIEIVDNHFTRFRSRKRWVSNYNNIALD